ncbi:MAG TPA: redoxin domain-containing protein [Thermoanaerobaculia bacterium]|jgi:peroxiredoxin|nr:redoxin domain-containing protein [Thermoanaerobaculia bacterium]
MPGPISIGDEAPNFDLSSTEECLLMLKDEVVRTAVVVYFFADPASERVLRDLDSLNRRLGGLVKMQTRVLAVSPVPLDDLRKLQRERKLLFPLLHDDRNFAAAYGVASSEEGKPYAPALVLVDRRQRVRFLANPVASAEESFSQIEGALKDLPSPTKSYPKSVVNRLIDRWVN